MPPGGLFAGQHWRIAPDPFVLEPAIRRELEELGRVLLQFYRATNLLYRQSARGKQPEWIARWLDQGKPQSLIELQRHASLKNDLPRVIRPDLLLTAEGLRLTELDSVPGGIGLTAWLNETYADLGCPVMGGREGMLQGFASIFDNAATIHILISEEAAAYRPEMLWLAERLTRSGRRTEVRDAAAFSPTPGDAVYRFFELFDVDNVPAAHPLFEAAIQKTLLLTPAPRCFLEEKLLFALLWNRRLRGFWRLELGAAFFDRLCTLVPESWIVDPSPLPPHAAIPSLNLTDWQELKTLSQKERELILKISGFSPAAWGARGVHLGSDLSATAWSAAVDRALADFPHSPYVLQRYEKPCQVPMRWLHPNEDRILEGRGRVRLCPYYFVAGALEHPQATLGGVLATVCPADKKILHGMTEAVMAPCAA